MPRQRPRQPVQARHLHYDKGMMRVPPHSRCWCVTSVEAPPASPGCIPIFDPNRLPSGSQTGPPLALCLPARTTSRRAAPHLRARRQEPRLRRDGLSVLPSPFSHPSLPLSGDTPCRHYFSVISFITRQSPSSTLPLPPHHAVHSPPRASPQGALSLFFRIHLFYFAFLG